MENVYRRKCACTNHSHKNQPCSLISAEIFCKKCKTPNDLVIPYQSLLFHARDLQTNRMFKCCVHTHHPPCGYCVSCRTENVCIIKSPFECEFTTNAVYFGPKSNKPHATKILPFDQNFNDHLHETQVVLFYFCDKHAHKHVQESVTKFQDAVCYIQTIKCCDEAVFVKDLKQSFSIIQTVSDDLQTQLTTVKEFVIYDPSLWRDQSFSYFTSLIKAFLWAPQSIVNRYKNFESSNFKVSNIKKYKSGKHSIVRTAITRFETNGIYQTATISCDLPQDTVLIPQCLANLFKENYDLSFVCMKRDPSIKPTCMFVLRALINPDPSVHVNVINDVIAKPLNQDQDGDKNAIYALPKHTHPRYDKFHSFLHKTAKIEMSMAFTKRFTLIAQPRYSFSENSRQLIHRHSEWLLDRSVFFKRTHANGLTHMIEAGCGYLHQEYDEFCTLLRHLNNNVIITPLTFDNVIGKTERLTDIIRSGTKGHMETLNVFQQSMFNNINRSLEEQIRPSKEQMSRYITSGQELRSTGRERFILLYSQSELKSSFGTIYLNNKPYINKRLFDKKNVEAFVPNLRAIVCSRTDKVKKS
ncbi:hypothetical protein AGLY_011562 [Aphis glycines]|uniref:Uncharacterized protein n=1 Tax=Aphis glycines TaxID=307491 RepID=A0A6G0TCS9_APHGL|nr:hypothetical protein AGLY_011562 [Aphis glycines]